jgi:hypothetical protein
MGINGGQEGSKTGFAVGFEVGSAARWRIINPAFSEVLLPPASTFECDLQSIAGNGVVAFSYLVLNVLTGPDTPSLTPVAPVDSTV